MYLQTPRLCIRDYQDEDWMDLLEILSDPVVMEKCEPVYDEIRTKEILHLFRSRNIGFAAVHRESEKVIGHILFCQLPPPDPEGIFELGWFFNHHFWHQGYAYEASIHLLEYGFRELDLSAIRAETIDPDRAGRLLEKLGMRLEKILPGTVTDPAGRKADLYWYTIQNPKEES